MTAEALFVPLMSLVLHLLHAGFKWLVTSVATRGELRIVTVRTVDAFRFRSERLIDETDTTFFTAETRFMPMLLLI